MNIQCTWTSRRSNFFAFTLPYHNVCWHYNAQTKIHYFYMMNNRMGCFLMTHWKYICVDKMNGKQIHLTWFFLHHQSPITYEKLFDLLHQWAWLIIHIEINVLQFRQFNSTAILFSQSINVFSDTVINMPNIQKY